MYLKIKFPKEIPPDFRDILRINIYDCVGNEITPGSIVAYPSNASLKFGVYEGIIKDLVKSKSLQYRIQLCTINNNKIRRTVIGSLKYDKETDMFSVPNNIIIIKNPLFHLNNKSITSCLKIIDFLKDEAILDKDFKLS